MLSKKEHLKGVYLVRLSKEECLDLLVLLDKKEAEYNMLAGEAQNFQEKIKLYDKAREYLSIKLRVKEALGVDLKI